MQHHSISQNITDYTAKQNAFGRLSFYQQSLYKHGILSMDLDLFVKYNTLDPIISKLQPKVILFFKLSYDWMCKRNK